MVYPPYKIFNLYREEERALRANNDFAAASHYPGFAEWQPSTASARLLINEQNSVIIHCRYLADLSLANGEQQVFVRNITGLEINCDMRSCIVDNGVERRCYQTGTEGREILGSTYIQVHTLSAHQNRGHTVPYQPRPGPPFQVDSVRVFPRNDNGLIVAEHRRIKFPRQLTDQHIDHRRGCHNQGMSAEYVSRPTSRRCIVGCMTRQKPVEVHAICADRLGTMCVAIADDRHFKMHIHWELAESQIAVISRDGELLYRFHTGMRVESMRIDAHGTLVAMGHADRYSEEIRAISNPGKRINELRYFYIQGAAAP